MFDRDYDELRKKMALDFEEYHERYHGREASSHRNDDYKGYSDNEIDEKFKIFRDGYARGSTKEWIDGLNYKMDIDLELQSMAIRHEMQKWFGLKGFLIREGIIKWESIKGKAQLT